MKELGANPQQLTTEVPSAAPHRVAAWPAGAKSGPSNGMAAMWERCWARGGWTSPSVTALSQETQVRQLPLGTLGPTWHLRPGNPVGGLSHPPITVYLDNVNSTER